MLSYSKYSLLALPPIGIEPAKAPSNQMLYLLHHVSFSDNSEWIFATHKPNVSITSWDTPVHYRIRFFFFTIAHIAFFFLFYRACLINSSQIWFGFYHYSLVKSLKKLLTRRHFCHHTHTHTFKSSTHILICLHTPTQICLRPYIYIYIYISLSMVNSQQYTNVDTQIHAHTLR